MMLLSNEVELVSSNESKIILTNQRIQMTDREWGSDYSISIFLEEISSIEVRYVGNVVLLAIGVIAALFCFYIYMSGMDDVLESRSSTIAIVFIAFYWLSRKRIVSITSRGGRALKFEASGLQENEIQKFITKVQEAKLQRLQQLKS